MEEATEEKRGRVDEDPYTKSERDRQRVDNGIEGGAGLTIACKSRDKRPGIVKTRTGRDSILIFYLVSVRYTDDKRTNARNEGGNSNSPTMTFDIYRGTVKVLALDLLEHRDVE